MNFTTDLSPAAAREAFLADKSSPYAQDGEGNTAVQCRSGKSTVHIFFTVFVGDDATGGELDVS